MYQNELDKACFQHDMVYGDFKNLPRKTAADKVLQTAADKLLCDEAFDIAKTSRYDGYQRGYQSFLIKILQVVLVKMKPCKMKN